MSKSAVLATSQKRPSVLDAKMWLEGMTPEEQQGVAISFPLYAMHPSRKAVLDRQIKASADL